MFIETTDPDQAEGDVAEIYAGAAASWGFVPNWARVVAVRPDMARAWERLIGTLSSSMDRRRYELATLAAARTLGSTYCSLAHTKVLRDRFHDEDDVRAIVTGPEAAGALDDTDREVMAFAAKVAGDASAITDADLEPLRARGLADGDILDVVFAAAARSFFAKVLDGVGACADAELAVAIGQDVTAALTVGRPPEGA